MKTIYGLRHIKTPAHGSVVTIGVFDGVHLGHREIITRAVTSAKKRKAFNVVITFDPHPAKVLRSGSEALSLISLKHRIRLIEELGADLLLIIKFTRSFSRISPENFVKNILIDRLRMDEILIGGNFYFGRGAEAGIAALKRLSAAYRFKVKILKPVKRAGHIVSSSVIRKLILEGRLHKAAVLLGRPVSVLGTVVKGYGLATELGFPTANINPHHEVTPPSGVYAVIARVDGKGYRGVVNIGFRPTFYSSRDEEPTIEVHLFGFMGNLYGRDIEVDFVKKLRDERKFRSKEALIRQVRADAALARNILVK